MKISVVIPSYNSSRTIGACLDGLMRQTHPADEIIVVDSSRDDTPQFVRQHYPAVDLRHLDRQTMPGAARNLGMDAARGDVLLFTDADAVPDPDWVARHLAFHTDRPEVTAVGGAIMNANPECWISRLAFIAEFTGYSPRDPAGPRRVVPSVNLSVNLARVRAAGIRMPERSLPGGEDVYFCNALIEAGMRVWFDPAPGVRHINRTTWGAYLAHMRSSGRAAGRIAADHAVDYRWLVRLGPFAVLAVPVRLWRVWVRMSRLGGAALAESLLLSPALAWGLSVQMFYFWRGARHV